MKFNTPYSPRVGDSDLGEFSPSLTKQAHKDECDINRIVRRYDQTGVWEHVKSFEPVYASLEPFDYQESMNKVIAAQEAFDALPSVVRKRFENDPAQFLAFAQDPDNALEMVKMGLAESRPIVVEVDKGPVPPVGAPEKGGPQAPP